MCNPLPVSVAGEALRIQAPKRRQRPGERAFLVICAGLTYAIDRRIWKGIAH